MAIGGKREGAGRKSVWRSPTKMMRFPIVFESRLLEYAKLLDSESESNGAAAPGVADVVDSDSEPTYTESEIAGAIVSVLLAMKPSDRAAANKLFKKLLTRLQSTL